LFIRSEIITEKEEVISFCLLFSYNAHNPLHNLILQGGAPVVVYLNILAFNLSPPFFFIFLRLNSFLEKIFNPPYLSEGFFFFFKEPP
jgi:hypothetical protein